MREISGSLQAAPMTHIAIVASRFNGTIVKNLVDGAVDALVRVGVASDNITITWVPGAFEIPIAAKRWAGSGAVEAVICLGAVIRGATPHFDYIAGQAASGVASVALETGVPVIFGVLTTETIEQAVERSGTKAGNKGYDAALAAIEMVNVMSLLPAGSEALVRDLC